LVSRFGIQEMTASGHEQPYDIVAILACERLLPSVNQPLTVAIPKFPN
jgi:hypothetical protein